jgi:hypothetical protein
LPPLLDLLQALTLLLQKRRELLETNRARHLVTRKTLKYSANNEKSSYKTRLEMQLVVSNATSAVQGLEYTRS